MKTLDLAQMENVNGGGWFECSVGIFAVGAVVGVAVFAPGAALVAIASGPGLQAGITLAVGGLYLIAENC